MIDETITVRCVCGWETSGPQDDVVAATVEHGQRLHNMTATRDEVLAMAVATPDPRMAQPADSGAGAPRG
jgi:predicted small metal-binding protein